MVRGVACGVQTCFAPTGSGRNFSLKSPHVLSDDAYAAAKLGFSIPSKTPSAGMSDSTCCVPCRKRDT